MLTTNQLAKALGVSVPLISKNTCAGKLKAFKPNIRLNLYDEKDAGYWYLEERVKDAMNILSREELLAVVAQIIDDNKK